MFVVLAALSMTTLSGCVAELFVIRTVEEIQRSEYRAEYASTKTPDTVTRCMMQTRHSPHFSQLRKLMIKGLVSQ